MILPPDDVPRLSAGELEELACLAAGDPDEPGWASARSQLRNWIFRHPGQLAELIDRMAAAEAIAKRSRNKALRSAWERARDRSLP